MNGGVEIYRATGWRLNTSSGVRWIIDDCKTPEYLTPEWRGELLASVGERVTVGTESLKLLRIEAVEGWFGRIEGKVPWTFHESSRLRLETRLVLMAGMKK